MIRNERRKWGWKIERPCYPLLLLTAFYPLIKAAYVHHIMRVAITGSTTSAGGSWIGRRAEAMQEHFISLL